MCRRPQQGITSPFIKAFGSKLQYSNKLMHNKKIKYFFMSAGKYVKLVKFEKDLYFLSKLPLESWIFFSGNKIFVSQFENKKAFNVIVVNLQS